MIEVILQVISPFVVLVAIILLCRHFMPSKKVAADNKFNKVKMKIKDRHGVNIFISSLMPIDFKVYNNKPDNNYHVSYDALREMFIIEPTGFQPINAIMWDDAVILVNLLNKSLRHRDN